jgi:uncharacterized membrane protein YqjE
MAEPLYGREPHDKSLGELFGELSSELTRLVRQEIELAKVELTEKGKAQARILARSAAYFGGAAVAAFMAIGSLTAAAILLLSLVMAGWIAAVIVMVVWGIIAGVLAYAGKQASQKVAPPIPEKTIETVKDDIQWAKNQRTSRGT